MRFSAMVVVMLTIVPLGAQANEARDYFDRPLAAPEPAPEAVTVVGLAAEVAPQEWDPLESTCRHASLSIL